MNKQIYFFDERSNQDAQMLGGKGANLAEMTGLGLPVPPGFTITTKSCVAFLADSSYFNQSLQKELLEAIHTLEGKVQKSFSNQHPLLLVSVRSGAAASMPGMMDTILNLGLNDDRVHSFAHSTTISFAFDCYRRLLQMFGDVVYGIPKEHFNQCLAKSEKLFNKSVTTFCLAEQESLIQDYHQVYSDFQKTFPQDPFQQLTQAVQAVFNSWNNHRAKVYRKLHGVADDLGTAVTIQSMVFGNSGQQSGTGVVFTRHPATGEAKCFGEFLLDAQGEDVVAGIQTPEPIEHLAMSLPEAYNDFQRYAKILEQHYQEMQDIEFTIEHSKLYLLQTRTGKRTAKAAVKIAVDFVSEGLITREVALQRISPLEIEQLIHPCFNTNALQAATLMTVGLPASPGAATGELVFTAEKAKTLSSEGRAVILVRKETSPEDIEGMIASQAIVTTHGGMTSHAAVVARGMGTCCVTGCEDLTVDEDAKTLDCGQYRLTEGDLLSVDGSTGCLYLGTLETVAADHDPTLETFLSWADEQAQMRVFANAETLQDLKTAIAFGANGIGLARTEHMFFGNKRVLEMRRLILAEDKNEQAQALAKLLAFQQLDFYQMFKTVQGKPIVIRLLDPPLHEFLPHETSEIQQLAQQLKKPYSLLERRIDLLRETNPMLGHRGCRLGITQPQIYQMQIEAIFRSALQLVAEGLVISPKIMIPLVATKEELLAIKNDLTQTIEQLVITRQVPDFHYEIGTMIELPRACLIADQLAESADFFSFGTNDLTQMTYGISRDDIGKFLPAYIEKNILNQDPFQHLDQASVGELIKLAVEKARAKKPTLSIGVCGEVGGDPQSIAFFQKIGIDYLSCSPYRIPVARLAAAQANLNQSL